MTVTFTEEEKEYIEFPDVWEGVVDSECPDDLKRSILEKVEALRLYNEKMESPYGR